MQVPSGFTTGLLIEAATEGKIAVGFAKDGVLMGDFTLSPLDVANMAAAMLAASKDGAGNLPARDGDSQSSGAVVQPSSFSLGPGAVPGEEALLLSFAESHLALSMQPRSMQSLGEKMVSLANLRLPQ